MNEIFKDVEGYEGKYQISNLGRFKSLHYINPRIINPHISVSGYCYLVLHLRGVKSHKRINRLVAFAFIINYESSKIIVNHIDGNILNNRSDNLEWVTHRENTAHGFINRNTSSNLIGVSWRKDNKKWRARILINKKNISLGNYDTKEEAHQAYLDALKEYGIINKYASI